MCGICGVYGHENAAFLTYLMMFAQQHRGQEGAGMIVANERWVMHKNLGLVVDVFKLGKLFDGRLTGTTAIGHNRYSTSGSSRSQSIEERAKSRQNLQPFSRRGLAVVYNGNITNYVPLRRELESQGAEFKTDVDTEVIVNFLTMNKKMPLEERVFEFSRKAKGAYSMAIMEKTGNGNSLLLVRDPLGFRPLAIGLIEGTYPVFASENRAFQKVGAKYVRETEPGEIVRIDCNGINNAGFIDHTNKRAYCIFELIYFTMPDSWIFDQSSGRFKRNLGGQLAIEQPADVDVVVGVPDSATSAASGYAQQSKIPEGRGLVRSPYIGRTFINPEQFTRELGVKIKFSADPDVVGDKRVVVVDDSIVRGTTTPHVIQLLKDAGARKVHMRVTAPPIRWPCFYGIDMPDQRKFAAHNRTIEEICEFIGADSLGYLSVEGMLKCGAHKPGDYCAACFTGSYPSDISDVVETQMQRIKLREKAVA